ncbi:MAG: ATP-dependent RecD-like DNA helicase [Clostridia bacterium]|nr:ATP-dependent RecD-like DNA helicase [Clostridia bacterium]
MSEEMIRIEGVCEAVIFRNDDNGYAVLRINTAGGDAFTAVGCVPRAGVGEHLAIVGQWIRHPAYGEQFKIEECERSLPATEGAILEYLSSGTVRGIGRKTAVKIVERFGKDSFDVIENDPMRLTEISGITVRKAEEISKDFQMQNAISRLIEFLVENDIEPSIALRLYSLYGVASIGLIRDNPYLLTNMELGVEFSKADSLADKLGMSGNSMERVEAAVLYELSYNAEGGHAFIPRRKLSLATADLIDVDIELVEDTIDGLYEDGLIMIEEISGEFAVYLSHLYEAECFIAKRLVRLMASYDGEKADAARIIEKIEKANNIQYAPLQKEAIKSAANNAVMVITGGPGTGKTTVICGILAMFEKMGLKVQLAAPTGRAAKRMSEFCGMEAKTIHRMLEMDYSEGGMFPNFGINRDNPLDADVLILDEVSMIDIMLMRATLDAMRPDCRLILVGDADQLPSIGAGNILKDLVTSEYIPTVRLTEIFRQAAESNIVVGAHAINNGEYPDFSRKDTDLFFLRREGVNEVVDTVVDLCVNRLPNKMDIPSNQIQVLTPSRKFEVGTVILNRKLQEALNPPSKDKNEKRLGEKLFREGDRVMQIRNNYDLPWYSIDGKENGMGVFNGDVGEIISIDVGDEILSVKYDDKVCHYAFTMLNELELAYAMTVHKAQGSEFRAVVFAALGGAKRLLHRSVLYTAITRAKELLILVSNPHTIGTMVENNKARNRYSALKRRIELNIEK